MIFHLIEILLLFIILATQQGTKLSGPQDIWQWLALILIVLFFGLADKSWYENKVDYDKIRRMIREEMKRCAK